MYNTKDDCLKAIYSVEREMGFNRACIWAKKKAFEYFKLAFEEQDFSQRVIWARISEAFEDALEDFRNGA